MNTFRSFILAALATLTTLWLPVATAETGVRPLAFEVFLDDRPIGYQRFDLIPESGGERIESRADFAVKFLGVTAFSYEHRNVERWRDGCLQSIDSRTDSNGTRYLVAGRRAADAFVVDSGAGPQRLSDCIGSFAYWDKRKLLGRRMLLNPQTGDYVQVEIRALGQGQLRLDGRDVPVERYALRGTDLDITLAYALEGDEWVGLDSKVAGGRMLRYRRTGA
jgi:hypothetical protein